MDLHTGVVPGPKSVRSLRTLSAYHCGGSLHWPTLAYQPRKPSEQVFCETTSLYNIFSFDSTPLFSKEAFGTLPIPPLGRHFILIVLLPQSKMGDRAPDTLVTLLSVPRGNEHHGFDRVNCLL